MLSSIEVRAPVCLDSCGSQWFTVGRYQDPGANTRKTAAETFRHCNVFFFFHGDANVTFVSEAKFASKGRNCCCYFFLQKRLSTSRPILKSSRKHEKKSTTATNIACEQRGDILCMGSNIFLFVEV